MDDLLECAEAVLHYYSSATQFDELAQAAWLCEIIVTPAANAELMDAEYLTCLELLQSVRSIGQGVHSSYVAYDLAA